MRSLPFLRRRLVAACVVGTLALAACGGGTSDQPASDAAALPTAVVADAVTLDPAADISTNLLPDLVVDDLGADNKVNLRNYGTSDKPILLWMWAPH